MKCEICKKNIETENPKFIAVDDIKEGMKLKRWFKTYYEPIAGEYRPCDNYELIRKIDGNLIYTSINGCYSVLVYTKESFTTYTELSM